MRFLWGYRQGCGQLDEGFHPAHESEPREGAGVGAQNRCHHSGDKKIWSWRDDGHEALLGSDLALISVGCCGHQCSWLHKRLWIPLHAGSRNLKQNFHCVALMGRESLKHAAAGAHGGFRKSRISPLAWRPYLLNARTGSTGSVLKRINAVATTCSDTKQRGTWKAETSARCSMRISRALANSSFDANGPAVAQPREKYPAAKLVCCMKAGPVFLRTGPPAEANLTISPGYAHYVALRYGRRNSGKVVIRILND